MKFSNLIAVLVTAGAIAATVAFILTPRLDAREPGAKPLGEETAAANALETSQAAPGETRRSASLRMREDGHYWARALVNRKASVDFMVDTGASIVALNEKDARKMGFKLEELTYDATIRTAGGSTLGAYVTIDSIKINQVHIRNVDAVILRTDMDQSLLGMSFLRELYSYEFRGDRLIIRQ
ncbi:MAG: TIGR02281 family clan AA aspartic protease [Pseudomonadota bacterium]